MKKKYYEVVFEGHYRAVYGLLEGFLLASNKDWNFYFSRKNGIHQETFGELIMEWITMKARLHHVVMDGDFYDAFEGAIRNCVKCKDSKFVHLKYIRSAKEIKNAAFKFKAVTYGRKYGTEIKAIINNLPSECKLHDYNPIEKDRGEDGKGIELYAPEHDYVFECDGRVEGDVKQVIDLRKEFDDHPLIQVQDIRLEL